MTALDLMGGCGGAMALTPPLAMADMRGNLYAVAVLLGVGILLLRRLRQADHRSSTWLPIACLIAGPLSAATWLGLDALIYAEEYLNWKEFWATGWRVLTVGAIGGVVGALVLWVGVSIHISES